MPSSIGPVRLDCLFLALGYDDEPNSYDLCYSAFAKWIGTMEWQDRKTSQCSSVKAILASFVAVSMHRSVANVDDRHKESRKPHLAQLKHKESPDTNDRAKHVRQHPAELIPWKL